MHDLWLRPEDALCPLPSRSVSPPPVFFGARLVTRIKWAGTDDAGACVRLLDALRTLRPETAW